MKATPHVVDFTFRASLVWPEKHWYVPTTFAQAAAQAAIRSARAQGLPDRIQDPVTVGKLSILLESGSRDR